MLNVDCATSSNLACLSSSDDLLWLWHRGVPHIHMHHLNKLVFKELVRGLPKLKFVKGTL